ncbi:MAG TPA: hypothetical protein VIU13_08460 [Chryseolinea sp.]
MDRSSNHFTITEAVDLNGRGPTDAPLTRDAHGNYLYSVDGHGDHFPGYARQYFLERNPY